ncbi:unnamed protein product [Allacma fusca]|uniref:Uncharacterized protein n=1 Tax=Allacma fusca TaxID=39272 RepID=A0A8J2K317_9HEXA|nr:unnamed protein product [Allacma fusca]
MGPHFDQLNHLPPESHNFSNNQNDTTAVNEENASHLLQIQLTPPNLTHARSSNCETVMSPSGIDGREQREMCSCDRNPSTETYSAASGSNLEDVDGGKNRISRNFSLHKISSLPNSPILKNVRKFCSFRLGDQKHAKIFNSTAKLNCLVSSVQGEELNPGVYSHQSADGMNFQRHYSSEDRKKCFTSTDEEIESL